MDAEKKRELKHSKAALNDYARIIAGVTLLAAAIMVFYEPNGMVTGGISGLCIIVAEYARAWFSVETPLSILNIIFNLPLLIVGYVVLGKNFIWRTIFATVYLSVALELASYLPVYKGDNFIVAIFGGVCMGIGVGLTIRSLATTGGSDLFATILHKLKKHISVANAMFVFDAVVIAMGFVVFGLESGLYAIVSVFISSKVVDNILEGLNFSKGAFIISPQADEIASDIMEGLERGVTGLNGRGMYTKEDMSVLLCIVAAKEVITLKNIVMERDPKAFLIVTDVKETLGEGFAAY